MKSGLSVGEGEVVSGHFSKEELRDLFSFREDTVCETHDLLKCSCTVLPDKSGSAHSVGKSLGMRGFLD